MSTATNIIMYKSIYTCQVCQSGNFAADDASLIYLWQFRHLNDRIPDRHQVRAFYTSCVGLPFCLYFEH